MSGSTRAIKRDLAAEQRTQIEPLWGYVETATFLDVPEETLRAWTKRRIGPKSYRVGKYRKFMRADVLAWLETRATTPVERRVA